MSKLICGSKEAALSALDAIAGNMSPGTPKEALEAVAAWVKKTIPDDVPREERERLMLSIFEKETRTLVRPRNIVPKKQAKSGKDAL